MDRAVLDGITLAYEERGRGEPVVLVHAGVLGDFFAPLLGEPALVERYRLISYHRVNYGESEHVAGPVGVAEQAGHCRALLAYLGIGRAHAVGHSAGASIALQLALDAPEVVHSLAVLDPALSTEAVADAPMPPFIARAMAASAAGDRAGAVDAFMAGVCGPGYRTAIEVGLPVGAFERAVADADGLFRQELAALRAWRFTEEDARRIGQPVLVVRGAESPGVFEQRQRWLLERLLRGAGFVLAGAGHLLQVEQPRALAEALAEFFGRHPLGDGRQAGVSAGGS